MNSRVVTSIVTAAFVVTPLVCSAQRSFGPTPRRDITLLTGPHLLSPASPPQSPMANQQWVFIKASTGSEAASAAASRSAGAANSTLLPKSAYSLTNRGTADANSSTLELGRPAFEARATPQFRFEPADQTSDPHGQLRAAEERAQKLHAEREAASKRQDELKLAPDRRGAEPLRQTASPTLPADPIRFDAYVPAMPTQLLPATPKSSR